MLKIISVIIIGFIPDGLAEFKDSSLGVSKGNAEEINANEYRLGPGDILGLKFLGNPLFFI